MPTTVMEDCTQDQLQMIQEERKHVERLAQQTELLLINAYLEVVLNRARHGSLSGEGELDKLAAQAEPAIAAARSHMDEVDAFVERARGSASHSAQLN